MYLSLSGQLGASVALEFDAASVTHLIAMHQDQPDVQRALAAGKQVANVDWMYACSEQKKCLPILDVSGG
jgi:hypothetical protein